MPNDLILDEPLYAPCPVCGLKSVAGQRPHPWCKEIDKLRVEVDKLARRVDALKKGTD